MLTSFDIVTFSVRRRISSSSLLAAMTLSNFAGGTVSRPSHPVFVDNKPAAEATTTRPVPVLGSHWHTHHDDDAQIIPRQTNGRILFVQSESDARANASVSRSVVKLVVYNPPPRFKFVKIHKDRMLFQKNSKYKTKSFWTWVVSWNRNLFTSFHHYGYLITSSLDVFYCH